jgi:hypothetical protein
MEAGPPVRLFLSRSPPLAQRWSSVKSLSVRSSEKLRDDSDGPEGGVASGGGDVGGIRIRHRAEVQRVPGGGGACNPPRAPRRDLDGHGRVAYARTTVGSGRATRRAGRCAAARPRVCTRAPRRSERAWQSLTAAPGIGVCGRDDSDTASSCTYLRPVMPHTVNLLRQRDPERTGSASYHRSESIHWPRVKHCSMRMRRDFTPAGGAGATPSRSSGR